MLDKMLINHLDSMDAIAADIDAKIEALFKEINIDELMADPHAYMAELNEVFKEMLNKQIIPDSIQAGRKLAATIEKLRKGEKIEIPDSNNPTLNKDLAPDDQRRD